MKKIIFALATFLSFSLLTPQAKATILGGGQMFHSLVATTTTANEYVEIKDTLKLDPSEPPIQQEITELVYLMTLCAGANPIGEVTNIDIMGTDPPCIAGTNCCGTGLNLAPYYDLIEQQLLTNGIVVLTITVLMYDAGTDMEAVLTREMDYIDFGDGLFKELNHDNTVPVATPIELISFSASQVGDNVQLNWETATEVNNDYFIIERSSDAISYKEIGKELGAGNSTTLNTYGFADKNPLTGYNYYRLRDVSFQEEESVTDAIPVLIVDDKFVAKIFPTVFTDGINVHTSKKVDITIYSIYGEEVFNARNIRKENIDLSSLVSGLYCVQLTEYRKVVATERIMRQ